MKPRLECSPYDKSQCRHQNRTAMKPRLGCSPYDNCLCRHHYGVVSKIPLFYHKSYSLGKSYTHCFRLFYYTPVLPFLNMRM